MKLGTLINKKAIQSIRQLTLNITVNRWTDTCCGLHILERPSYFSSMSTILNSSLLSSESMRRKMRVCKICAILRFWEVSNFSSVLALQTSLVCCIIDWIWKFNLSSSFYNKNLSHNFEILAVNACQSRVLKMVFFKKCNGSAGLYGQRMTVFDGLYHEKINI